MNCYDKKSCLYTLAGLERERLEKLTREQLEVEYIDWFYESDIDDIKNDTSKVLIYELEESFMIYREDNSKGELIDIINVYKLIK